MQIPNSTDKLAQALLDYMTQEERFDFVASCAPDEPDAAVAIVGIERLNIPKILLADTTGGIRLVGEAINENIDKSTAFPCALLLAATWNPELSFAYARSIGEECRAAGIHFLLGPGVNIYRSSVNGRNFEYMGEDPYLASATAASYVKGMQSTGVAATVKHFICNNEEYKRRSCNAIVDERTLHEIYLPAFKAAIDAGVLSVMTAYNLLNGEWCGQNSDLINGLLREELGFKGLCMTDWTATWDGVKVAKSGTDLEKPLGEALRKDREKLLGSPEIDQMALNIFRTCIAAGFYNENFRDTSYFALLEQHEWVAEKVNSEGIVLLKNNGILPLDSARKDYKVLVSGNCAKRLELSGGGSGHVVGYNLTTYMDAVTGIFGKDAVIYEENPSEDLIAKSDLVLLFCGFIEHYPDEFYEGESCVRPFHLPEDAFINRCTQLNSSTVVCLVAGGGVSMDWEDNAAAIVHTLYGGQTGPKAIVDILTGKVNPSGKLPFTIEIQFEDSPAYGFDTIEPNWENPHYGLAENKRQSFFYNSDKDSYHTYDLPYHEGIFVGYRWYDHKDIEPRFCFGHGLSYTSYEYSNIEAKNENGNIVVTFCIKNTGDREGSEVAQIYVQDVECTVPRPVKELKGFKKISLKPGESKPIEVILDQSAFSYWEPEVKAWKPEPGEYDILVGASAGDIRIKKTIII